MTTTRDETLQTILNKADPTQISDAFRVVRIGDKLANVQVTVAALASATAVDITTPAVKAAITALTGLTLGDDVNLPAIGVPVSVRVTAGAAAAGPRQITDAGGTASATVALLSDDGTTLTFEAGVTGFVLLYQPRVAEPMTTQWATDV